MSDKNEKTAGLLTLPSVAQSSDALSSMVRRGVDDLAASAEADRLFERGLSLWNQGKYREAVQCLAQSLRRNSNHAASLFYVGLAYYQGAGMPTKNYVQAAICWRKAGEQGNPEAQNNLGQCYEQGLGLPRDYQEAAFWFGKAAEQGHATAQFNLGVMYEFGRGLALDFGQAVAWYDKAAEQGCAVAQYNLGGIFRLGRGVPQDYARAALWYRRAADQHHATAEFNLAVMYELGQGVKPSLRHAAFWYHRAAEDGEESARQCLVDVLKELQECEVDADHQEAEDRTLFKSRNAY
jgi:TPR repeat protein